MRDCISGYASHTRRLLSAHLCLHLIAIRSWQILVSLYSYLKCALHTTNAVNMLSAVTITDGSIHTQNTYTHVLLLHSEQISACSDASDKTATKPIKIHVFYLLIVAVVFWLGLINIYQFVI